MIDQTRVRDGNRCLCRQPLEAFRQARRDVKPFAIARHADHNGADFRTPYGDRRRDAGDGTRLGNQGAGDTVIEN